MSVNPTSSTNSANNVPVVKQNAGLDTADFMNLLASQLKNQNPTEPTDTNQLLSQMVSYASYGQQEGTNQALQDTNDALAFIAQTLNGIASDLAQVIQEKKS